MKQSVIICFILCVLVVPCRVNAQSDWWKVIPPIITSPAPNEWYAKDAGIWYCWELADSVREEYVDYFEIMFANDYEPDPLGGICDWNFIRTTSETCWFCDPCHQFDHEPIYWRIRTVYTDGVVSNWAVSYHRVGDDPDVPVTLTIFEPQKTWYNCSPAVYHEWNEDTSAVQYEFGFAQTRPNILYIFDECRYHPRSPITVNHFTGKHDCIHLPIYFLVRAVYDDGAGGYYRSNWSITYYLMYDGCYGCNLPIGVERSTWGAIKKIYR